MKINRFFIIVFLVFSINNLFGQTQVLYKEVDSTKLFLEVYNPPEMIPNKKYPAMVFFYGGGWVGGTISQFIPQAKYFADRGMVCFLIDYRTSNKNKTTPFESLKDAKSAMRFLKVNADKFNIDTCKIVASGGSAGGHLAAATALIKDYNEKTDDLSVSCVPKALVLFNPVIDNGPGGYGYERIGDEYKNFSPLHNIQKFAPPTIIFLGTKDNLIPLETVKYYQTVMRRLGIKCELFLYEGQGHGFFNQKEYQDKTIIEADKFLVDLGFLEPK